MFEFNKIRDEEDMQDMVRVNSMEARCLKKDWDGSDI